MTTATSSRSGSLYTKFNNENSEEYENLPFVDFLPDCLRESSLFKSPKFSDFRSLIDKANDWLRDHPEYGILKCESVKFKFEGSKKENFHASVYIERGKSNNTYVKGLRIWVIRKKERKHGTQIGYLNVLPKETDKGSILTFPKYETIDEVLKNCNEKFRKEPLSGRIITIETDEINVGNNFDVYPDKLKYNIYYNRKTCFIYFLRIYYEITEPQYEEIGIKDFIPDVNKKGELGSTWETSTSLVHKITDWSYQQSNIRICNIQTIEMKLKESYSVNTKKMRILKSGTYTRLRVYRISYVKLPLSENEVNNLNPIENIMCKIFIPIQITKNINPNLENFNETKQNICSWLKITGAQLLSAETVPMKCLKNREFDVHSTLAFGTGESDSYMIHILKLYLTNYYPNPPENLRLPVTEI